MHRPPGAGATSLPPSLTRERRPRRCSAFWRRVRGRRRRLRAAWPAAARGQRGPLASGRPRCNAAAPEVAGRTRLLTRRATCSMLRQCVHLACARSPASCTQQCQWGPPTPQVRFAPVARLYEMYHPLEGGAHSTAESVMRPGSNASSAARDAAGRVDRRRREPTAAARAAARAFETPPCAADGGGAFRLRTWAPLPRAGGAAAERVRLDAAALLAAASGTRLIRPAHAATGPQLSLGAARRRASGAGG